jgi:hypothetical protein
VPQGPIAWLWSACFDAQLLNETLALKTFFVGLDATVADYFLYFELYPQMVSLVAFRVCILTPPPGQDDGQEKVGVVQHFALVQFDSTRCEAARQDALD